MRKGKRGLSRTPEGRVFRWIREEYLGGVKQIELARLLGTSPSYVSNVESGSTALSEKRAEEIAQQVARSPADYLAILLRLQEAILRTRMPEISEAMQYKRLRWSEDNEGSPPWLPWAEHVQGLLKDQGMTPAQLAVQLLEEDGSYVEGILAGEIMPLRADVRLIAEDLGEDPIWHLLLAGYLPDEAFDHPDLIYKLINIQLGEDDRIKDLIRSSLEHAAK